MPYKKSLRIPQRKKTGGLRLFCNRCRHELNTTSICSETGKLSKGCAEHHVFRAVVYEPGTLKRRVKVFATKDINEAIKLAVLFKDEVKNKKFKSAVASISEVKMQEHKAEKTMSLMQAATFFLAHKSAIRGAEHTLRKVSKAHIAELERSVVLLAQALKSRNVDPDTLNVNSFSQEHVGYYHSHLLERYAGVTYDKHIGNMRSMFEYLNRAEGFSIKNPFSTVRKRKKKKAVRSVEPADLIKLLSAITPENGVQTLKTGDKKSHYHSYIKPAILLGIYTGLRREQLVALRFENLVTDENGISVLVSDNLKVNRIQNIEEEEDLKKVVVPVSPQLYAFLVEMGLGTRKGSDYILAPNTTIQRKTIMDQISKSFTQFARAVGLPPDLSFKHLRKSYLTALKISLGDKSHILTHADAKVLEDHYIDQISVAKAAAKQDLFPQLNEKEKAGELKKIRSRKQKDISIER